MKGSASERFEELYRRVWGALNRPDDPDLSQHARQLLHHVPAEGVVSLTSLAEHLALPKSTASVLVKELARRGFVHRARDSEDERRLAIALTDQGRARLAADTVLDPQPLAAALARLTPDARTALLDGLEQLAEAAEAEGRRRGHAH
jgi:DNA-binding MarR family transcriptional regulator